MIQTVHRARRSDKKVQFLEQQPGEIVQCEYHRGKDTDHDRQNRYLKRDETGELRQELRRVITWLVAGRKMPCPRWSSALAAGSAPQPSSQFIEHEPGNDGDQDDLRERPSPRPHEQIHSRLVGVGKHETND